MIYKWILYELIEANGIGQQPYDILQTYNVHFDGGHYKIDDIYYGKLWGSSTSDILESLIAIAAFNPVEILEEQLVSVIEQLLPTNTLVDMGETIFPPKYIGPPKFDDTLTITRQLSDVPF